MSTPVKRALCNNEDDKADRDVKQIVKKDNSLNLLLNNNKKNNKEDKGASTIVSLLLNVQIEDASANDAIFLKDSTALRQNTLAIKAQLDGNNSSAFLQGTLVCLAETRIKIGIRLLISELVCRNFDLLHGCIWFNKFTGTKSELLNFVQIHLSLEDIQNNEKYELIVSQMKSLLELIRDKRNVDFPLLSFVVNLFYNIALQCFQEQKLVKYITISIIDKNEFNREKTRLLQDNLNNKVHTMLDNFHEEKYSSYD